MAKERPMSTYAIGIDFGTESARTVLVDLADGREVAAAVYPYSDGVIDERLPGSDVRLEPDWALQNPIDYVTAVTDTVPRVLQEAAVDPADVIGLGIDFTACTMLPTKADGTPLCVLPEYRDNPHAWVKLWKHHAAQPEADHLNAVARERGEPWLSRYGGKISSEWFFPKALQILNEAPEIYDAADRLIEAADWIVWQLTGVETRNACTAGYKAIWSKQAGFPSPDFFAALHPRMRNIVREKMCETIVPLGARAGGLTAEMAQRTGLRPGMAVAVANVDAHVSVPAATVVEPGRMVMIMGTSTCHMVLGTEQRLVPGMCGVVEDGILPGFFGYEAGQSCVGDHFAWFVENAVPATYQQEALERKIGLHQLLEEKAAALRPGESGLLALDWWNGNRSVLVDVDLTGMLLGATLATRPEDVYRALIEATAYGTRVIIETFEESGVAVNELVATGGLPDRNRLLMQIYADVTGREIKVAAAQQAGALGSAMHGAVAAGAAAGGYASIQDAAARMAHLRDEVYRPIAANKAIYDRLYAEYVALHDYFGRGANDVMKRLKAIKAKARA
ncbi:MAG TPA: ribulokinase [Chloroflexi bacterium]|jgi:L-ribulokinase|nr:ribulokinase [Chloroflexota bacterium]